MNNEYDISFRKLAMLSKAIQLADDEEQDDFPLKDRHGCTIDPLLEELKAAAFEVLLLNPGSEYDDWEQELIQNYHTEVIDVYGNDPNEVHPALRDLWESDYEDPASGLCMDFDEWARAFATEESRELYYMVVELRNSKE